MQKDGAANMFRVLFVCTGNICRSPTAHAILRDMVRQRGLNDAVKVDSAGTTAYHVGESADARTITTASRHGVLMQDLRARQFVTDDWQADLILLAGAEHYRFLQKKMPGKWQGELAMILPDGDVPDPYYGGQAGFDEVFGLLQRACEQWLQYIERRLGQLESIKE